MNELEVEILDSEYTAERAVELGLLDRQKVLGKNRLLYTDHATSLHLG
jgi:hypothetical protein